MDCEKYVPARLGLLGGPCGTCGKSYGEHWEPDQPSLQHLHGQKHVYVAAAGKDSICAICGLIPEDLHHIEERRSNDSVNPRHYHGDYVMRVIEDFKLDFLKGQVVKYVLRAGDKPENPELVDLQKALWYLQRKISNLELIQGTTTGRFAGSQPNDSNTPKGK